METIVKDPPGRITGIAIPASNIKLYIEKESDQIRLYGKMTANEGPWAPWKNRKSSAALQTLQAGIVVI